MVVITVLLIEDEDAIRLLLRTALEQAGYRVRAATNGAEGLRLFSETPADVVITDIFMPGYDGLEVIRRLRRLHPETKVLAVTGASDRVDYLEVARYLGAANVLRKPFELEVFLQTVAGLVSDLGADPPTQDSTS
jgi:two-component system chemotaxis response regulator CheY